jgi:hypothetical protein
MIIEVQYENFRYDYVDAVVLDRLIATRSIRRFYLPLVSRWVNVERTLAGRNELSLVMCCEML